MNLSESQAGQIAKLLNERNQLLTEYTAGRVLQHTNSIVFLTSGEIVIACAEARGVQWYQFEICHVSTHPD